MIIEHVHLSVRRGQSAAFEQAFNIAKEIIQQATGFQQLQLMQHHTNVEHYILQVHWDTLEHHTEGFRKSEAYLEWKALLHHFYDPMPDVEYFKPCDFL